MTSRAEKLVSSPSWGAQPDPRRRRWEEKLRLAGIGSWLEKARSWRSEAEREQTPRSWQLHDDGTLRLRPGARGLLLRCRSGTLVVTQEGDPLDHVLEAGEEIRTADRGSVVVWALSAGEMSADPIAR